MPMNFPKIFKSKDILDIAITKVRRVKDYTRNDLAHKYISAYQIEVIDKLKYMADKLPDYEISNDYYQMMFKNVTTKSVIEKYKNHILKTMTVINKLSEQYKRQLMRLQENRKKKYDKEIFVRIKKEYVGRLASVLKSLDGTFDKLIDLEKDFKRIAKPDFNLRTIVLIGLPNSGKTTFITKITSATPEINSYAFTTKALNVGYFMRRQDTYQVIDTPGLIHADFKEMNPIEKQAITAIKTLGDLVVFVYNPNLDFDEQKAMLKVIRENNPDKKIVVSSEYEKDQIMEGEINVSIKELVESYPIINKNKK
jgi:small GTP-binding protein